MIYSNDIGEDDFFEIEKRFADFFDLKMDHQNRNYKKLFSFFHHNYMGSQSRSSSYTIIYPHYTIIDRTTEESDVFTDDFSNETLGCITVRFRVMGDMYEDHLDFYPINLDIKYFYSKDNDEWCIVTVERDSYNLILLDEAKEILISNQEMTEVQKNEYMNKLEALGIEKEIYNIFRTIDEANDNEIEKSESLIHDFEEKHGIEDLLLALKLYPTGYAYFLLGDYFFELRRFNDAIEAYQISRDLNYEKSYYSLYNMACAYSRMKQFDESYEFLIFALKEGYEHYDWIFKDNDMSNLLNSDEYADLIYFDIWRIRQNNSIQPMEISKNVLNLSIPYSELDQQSIADWRPQERKYGDYTIITLNRISINPYAVALFCYKEDELQFILTPEEMNETSIEGLGSSYVKYYITFPDGLLEESDKEIIEKAITIFTHRA